MHEQIPPRLDAEFLAWFKQRTERTWTTYQTEDFTAARVGGRDWQAGSRWLDGLTDAEIDHVEQEWSIHFPPDYRLFLRHLHTVDRPMVGADFFGDKLRPRVWPSLYNWQSDVDMLRSYVGWPVKGLLFAVEHDDLWRPAWAGRQHQSRCCRSSQACAARVW